jgi:hypothetical protein
MPSSILPSLCSLFEIDFPHRSRNKPVQLIEVTPENISQNGPYDALLLRLTEALATKENSVLDPFSTYLEENPGVKVFDPIRGQLAAVDRQSMATATSLLNQNPGI